MVIFTAMMTAAFWEAETEPLGSVPTPTTLVSQTLITPAPLSTTDSRPVVVWPTPTVAATAPASAATTTTAQSIVQDPQIQSDQSDPPVVTNRPVDLRSGASGSHDRLQPLPAGEAVMLLGQRDGWLLVELSTGATGWLPERALTIKDPAALAGLPDVVSRPPLPELLTQVDAVTARQTTLYSGPGFSFPVLVDNVPPGSPMAFSGRDDLGMWLSVRDGFGEIGWVLASSLQFAPTFQIMNLEQTAGFAPEQTDLFPYDWSSHTFEWGGQTHDMGHSAEMGELGMQWIKVQHKFHADSRPRDVVGLITQAHERGFKILLAIPGEPYPDAIDYEAYVEFVAGVAELVDPPDAIEIWNEMNIDFEWPVGEIDPQLYVDNLLRPSYEAIKLRNPNIMVISGAPAPTGFDNGSNAWADDRYVAGMVQAGAGRYLDCIGMHYNAGATSPYALTGHPAGDFYGWYMQPAMNMYFRSFGGQRPLCITELGFLTDDDLHGQRMPDNFWWAAGTGVDEHARWLAEARQLSIDSGIVRMMIIFNMDIYHWDGRDPQTGYAIFRPQGNCPACEMFGER